MTERQQAQIPSQPDATGQADNRPGTLSRRALLRNGAGAALEVACGNTRQAYPDETTPITVPEFEKGIEMLPTPASRSMVLLEAIHGSDTYLGHAVMAYANDGTLKLYTAYHVVQETVDQLGGGIHWQMKVGNVGMISLEGIKFTPKPDSGIDSQSYSYGLMEADLTPFITQQLQDAFDQQTVLPAALAQSPNHDITTNKGFLVMYLADGNKAHNYLTVIEPSAFTNPSGLYRCIILQGGYCVGMSGSPAFKGKLVGKDTYDVATDDQGRYIVEAVTVLFSPDTTDPSEAYRYVCTDNKPFSCRSKC